MDFLFSQNPLDCGSYENRATLTLFYAINRARYCIWMTANGRKSSFIQIQKIEI